MNIPLTALYFSLVAGALAMVPASAHAHASGDGNVHHWWTLDPWVLIPLSLLGGLYLYGVCLLRRRHHAGGTVRWPALAAAASGGIAFFFALVWPLDAFSETSFAAHMAQHMLLIAVAAPLLALARMSVPIAAALAVLSPAVATAFAHPRKWLRWLLLPSVAFTLHGAAIWIWHAPLLFELALHQEWVHRLEHVSFLIAGYWYWSSLLRHAETDGEGYGAAALWSLSTLMHTGLLGALITFATRPLYPTYIDTQGSVAAALQDQQLAGLLMWIPVGACYLVGGLAFAGAWMYRTDRTTATRD